MQQCIACSLSPRNVLRSPSLNMRTPPRGYFSHTLFVSPGLDPLMSSVSGCKALLSVRWSMRVENFDIEVSPFITATPKAIGGNIQPSPVIAEAPLRLSPVIGCSVGSIQTSLQTSDNQLPTVSRTSLCRMEGKPPLGQDRECSTEKCVPQAQLVGVFRGIHPYLKARASLKPLCEVRSQTPPAGGKSTTCRHPSLGLGPRE